MLNSKELSNYTKELAKYRQICKCGRRTAIMPKKDWVICTWCGRKIYTKKGNFKKKLKEKLDESI